MIKKTLVMTFFTIIFLPINAIANNFTQSENTEEPLNFGKIFDTETNRNRDHIILKARQELKDYGLLNCLKAIDEQSSLLKDDLSRLSGVYHYASNGKYIIQQNEDTLDVIYDPYQTINQYFIDKKSQNIGVFKYSSDVHSFACFKIYHSDEFHKLIEEQDKYIDEDKFDEEYYK